VQLRNRKGGTASDQIRRRGITVAVKDGNSGKGDSHKILRLNKKKRRSLSQKSEKRKRSANTMDRSLAYEGLGWIPVKRQYEGKRPGKKS